MKTQAKMMSWIALMTLAPMGVHSLLAGTVIQDTFTMPDGVFIPFSGVDTGYSPAPTDLPGGTYQTTGGGGADGSFNGNRAFMHNGGAVGLALGSYNDAAALTISAQVSFYTPLTLQSENFLLLGFFNAASTGQYQSGLAKFTGLRLELDGSLQLYVGGSASGSSVAYGGVYDPSLAATLSYSIDTTTGAISGISFGSSSADYSSIASSGFSELNTEYAGIGGSLGNVNNYAVFDDFTVATPVPEPNTWAMLGGGVLLVAWLRRARLARSS